MNTWYLYDIFTVSAPQNLKSFRVKENEQAIAIEKQARKDSATEIFTRRYLESYFFELL